MNLARVYLVDEHGERSGITHAAWWDGENYMLVCGTRLQNTEALLLGDVPYAMERDGFTTGPVACRRCRRAKLPRFRLVRWAAKTWEGR